MDEDSLLGSDAWKLVYDECWELWTAGLSLLRNANDARDAASAKQMMKDAERIVRLPSKKLGKEGRKVYETKLAKKQNEVLKKEFEHG